jgi:glycosyltransferase involved in cell wall biosynthesis
VHLRILFIHEVNYLSKPIFEMHEFPEYLAARGHEIFYLHFPEGCSRAELSESGWSREIPGRAMNNVLLTLLTPKTFFTNLLGRLLAALWGHRIVKDAIRTARPDLVVTLAVPTFGWQAVRVAKGAGIPLVYRALDVSHLIRGSVFGNFVKKAEAFVIKRADFVSANNAAMAQYIRELGGRTDKVEVHFPPMDLKMYGAGDKGAGRDRIGLSASDQVVLYMGSFFYFSGLSETIREFSRLDPDGRTKLVLVGGGDLDKELRALVKEYGLEKQVLFTGFVDFEALPDYLAAADVFINPMKRSLVSDTALPNKVIQYLAASRPVVSTALKGVGLTFEGYGGLHLVQSPEECVKRALEILAQKEPIPCSNHNLLNQSFGTGAVTGFESFLERAAT